MSTILLVMQMSRMERKKKQKKSKRYLWVFVIMQVFVLIYGLFTTDAEVRKMMGVDDIRLLGYEQLSQGQYNVEIMGEKHAVDTASIQEEMHNTFAEFTQIVYNIKKWLETKYEKILQ